VDPDLVLPARQRVDRRPHAAATHPLGILTFEPLHPQEAGDIGCAETFPFPVRYGMISRNAVRRVAHSSDDALLALYIREAANLIDQGCIGVVSTCSFLARWQTEFTLSLTVPVLTSALLQVPLVQRLLPHRQRVGIVIASAIEVDAATLQAAGADAFVAIETVDPDGHFATGLREPTAAWSRARAATDVVAAARRLVAGHPHTGAIVLESAAMSAYRDAVARAVAIPVFSATQLFSWFYAALRGSQVPLEGNPF